MNLSRNLVYLRILFLLALSGTATAQPLTLSQMYQKIDQAFPDNVAGKISAAQLRARFKDVALMLDRRGTPDAQPMSVGQVRAISAGLLLNPPRAVLILDVGRAGVFYLDNNDVSTPDNGGTVLVTASGLRYKRQLDGLVLARWFFFDGAPADYAPRIQLAINVAKAAGLPLVLPAGTYPVGPITLVDSIDISGQPGGLTRLIRNAIRGYAFSGKVSNVTLSDLYINSDIAPIEGGVRICGSRNTVRNIILENPDATGITVSTRMNNADAGVPAQDNVVEGCVVRGQKRYHEVAGTSPFLAGDGALRTVFRNCLVENCNNSVPFDYYDSDNAPGTLFQNCVAKKAGAMANATAFWSEGEQVDTDHTATFQGCYAINFSNAFGSSERAKVTILGSRADSCRHGFVNLNGQFAPYIKNVRFLACGFGITGAMDGIIATTGAIILENVTVAASAPVQSFVNYRGGNGQTREPIRITGCSLDATVNLSEQNTGSLNISVDKSTFSGAVVIDNSPSAQVAISNSTFQDAVFYSARSAIGSRIENCKFLAIGNTKTAVTQVLDNFNFVLNNNSFSGYQQAVDANSVASVGVGNSEQNNTSPLPSPNIGDLQYYNGRSWTRLPAGANGQTLRMVSGVPAWSN